MLQRSYNSGTSATTLTEDAQADSLYGLLSNSSLSGNSRSTRNPREGQKEKRDTRHSGSQSHSLGTYASTTIPAGGLNGLLDRDSRRRASFIGKHNSSSGPADSASHITSNLAALNVGPVGSSNGGGGVADKRASHRTTSPLLGQYVSQSSASEPSAGLALVPNGSLMTSSALGIALPPPGAASDKAAYRYSMGSLGRSVATEKATRERERERERDRPVQPHHLAPLSSGASTSSSVAAASSSSSKQLVAGFSGSGGGGASFSSSNAGGAGSWNAGASGTSAASSSSGAAGTAASTSSSSTNVARPNNASASQPSPLFPRRCFVMRHGERVDFAIGRDWIQRNFNLKTGEYLRTNVNMPRRMLQRSLADYAKDPPLTELGLWQARETSSSLFERGVRLTHIYCSPALRCVQTALEVLRGMELVPTPRSATSASTAGGGAGDDVGGGASGSAGGPVIRIEPGLFEWLGWYKNGLPNFMTAEQLHTQRYPVDLTYRAVHPVKQFNMNESIDQYFERSYRAVKTVLDSLRSSAAAEAGAQQTVFFIAHAGSLDTCTRLLLKRELRSNKQIFKDIASKVPYCGLCEAQEEPASALWALVQPPIGPLSHTENILFDWHVLHN